MKKVGLIIFGVVVAVFLFNKVFNVQVIRSIIREMGGSAEYDLSDCKPLPDGYKVNVVPQFDEYANRMRRVLTFSAENVKDARPYSIGYGTLDRNYIKLDIGGQPQEIQERDNGQVHINFTHYQPTIWKGDDYMGIRVFDKNGCYRAYDGAFKQSQWIVVLGSKGGLHESILSLDPTFEDCPLCQGLQQLEPATIIYVDTWLAAAELLIDGNVAAFILDNRQGRSSTNQSTWESVNKEELSQLFETSNSYFFAIDVPAEDYGKALEARNIIYPPSQEEMLRTNPSLNIDELGGYWIWYEDKSSGGGTGYLNNPLDPAYDFPGLLANFLGLERE